MITCKDLLFHLETKATSYVLRVNEVKHLVCEYYGAHLPPFDDELALIEKWPYAYGSSVIYDESKDKACSLDLISLEVSSIGKGDYREPAIKIRSADGYVFDFTYHSHEIRQEITPLEQLPSPHGGDEELIIVLHDDYAKVALELHYLVFVDSDIIVRNVVFINNSESSVNLEKIMSLQLDMINRDFSLLNLYGGWISEGQKTIRKITPGIYLNDSKTGSSSNRHNPFFMLLEDKASLNSGGVYAFNLMYSGNHLELVELTNYDKLRIQIGINPYCFDYTVKPGETFVTPYAVMTFANRGINSASQNMHRFVNNHVIPRQFINYERPILLNNWEATYMKFNEMKLLSLAHQAKKIGIELFVLDDGWFKNRDDDTKSLGDYELNKKKLPRGINNLAKKINDLGLKFGLWFEPEMVSEDSDLFRNHPDWIIGNYQRDVSKGRHQLVLDLSRSEVCDYIFNSLDSVLGSANIEYVKWDYNRHISDFASSKTKPGELLHRQVLGLYSILKRLTGKYPHILFEGCSSGGNRFDLGILSYMPQTWASDDTDAYQRLHIQSGYSLAYPLSSIGAHVSASPSHQLLRNTPIDTRFNVAAFGVLGYELDLSHLDEVETKAVKAQIAFYKKHRHLLQYGTFYQMQLLEEKDFAVWMVLSEDKKEGIIGYFNGLQKPNPKTTILQGIDFIDEQNYVMNVRPQDHNIKKFGGLINMVLPIRVNENGFLINQVAHHKVMPGEKESYVVSGAMINHGAIKLNPEWAGVGYDERVRVLGDFGSRLYHFQVIEK
ncbi:MAG: alpha-galactosidase [Methanomicrobia archaeon]|nr:alpha-galactosidase [Methanomicrobia archaeon]